MQSYLPVQRKVMWNEIHEFSKYYDENNSFLIIMMSSVMLSNMTNHNN